MSEEMGQMLREAAAERGVTISEEEIRKTSALLDKLNPGERIALSGGHEVAMGCGYLNFYPFFKEEEED
jgi:hypothetical protein